MLHFKKIRRLFSVKNSRFAILFALLAGATAAFAQLDTIRETYPDGSISRIYTVQQGTNVREGTSYSYHPNGQLAVEAPYINGKLDGVFRSYFESGKVWQTIGYKAGIEEGVSTTYYENGFKKSKEVYKSGILHGTVEEFYDNGKIRRRLPYALGSVHGVAKVYDQLGAVTEEMTFDKGLRHGPYRRFNKGIKTFEAKFEHNRCVENCDF